MNSLAPQDATRYWLSRRTVNDLFLLYCFTDAGRPVGQLRAEVLDRAARIPDLCVRLREHRFAYPEWVPCDVAADQIIDHALPDPTWPNVVAALADLLSNGVRAQEHPWRLHIFRDVRDAPGGDAPALIAVLQLSHALADGRRAAEIARALWCDAPGFGPQALRPVAAPVSSKAPIALGRPVIRRIVPLLRAMGDAVARSGPGRASRVVIRGLAAPLRAVDVATRPSVLIRRSRKVIREFAALLQPVEVAALLGTPIAFARTVVRGFAAEHVRQELEDLTVRGEIPLPATDFPLTLLNHPSAPSSHAIRVLVRDDLRVPGRTVTVVVATAIAQALSRYLAVHGDPNAPLAAQVSMSLPATEPAATHSERCARRRSRARNNYVDLGIELAADEPDPRHRADRIAAVLADRRTRATHPLMAARNNVTEVMPAPVLRRDIASYPLDLTPETLTGHTVISSVHRGPADLTFAGGRVLWTAGFPALGTVMHLTHGVHGLGDTVTVSIHADPAVIGDIDVYAALLGAALTETTTALRS